MSLPFDENAGSSVETRDAESIPVLRYPPAKFCDCYENALQMDQCECAYTVGGEHVESIHAWHWSKTAKTQTVRVSRDQKMVWLHGNFSYGNAVIRGDTPFVDDFHYYWEVRLMRPVFGSSTMIGIATGKLNLNTHSHDFTHFLGSDDQSWGLTSHCIIRHNQKNYAYHERAAFNAGTLVGVYLNMWQGTLEYFVNRRPMGIAFRGLRGQTLYPIISATSAHAIMRLCYSCISAHTLSFLAFRKLTIDQALSLPYQLRLKLFECWWLFPQREVDPATLQQPREKYSLRLIITSDSEEDDEFTQQLRERMRHVAEHNNMEMFKRRKKRKKSAKRKL